MTALVALIGGCQYFFALPDNGSECANYAPPQRMLSFIGS